MKTHLQYKLKHRKILKMFSEKHHSKICKDIKKEKLFEEKNVKMCESIYIGLCEFVNVKLGDL